MRCTEAREKLVEAVEGALPPDEQALLRQHLEGCARCRAEFEALAHASQCLRDALADLVPEETYLTAARRERLLAARARGRKPIRLITWRRFVVAAAAAAIIVSVSFLVGDVLWLLRGGAGADGGVGERIVVIVAAAPGEAGRAARFVPVRATVAMPAGRPGAVPRVVRTDSPGLRVPVSNGLYDAEESSFWW